MCTETILDQSECCQGVRTNGLELLPEYRVLSTFRVCTADHFVVIGSGKNMSGQLMCKTWQGNNIGLLGNDQGTLQGYFL